MKSNNIYRILTILLFSANFQYLQAGPVIRPSRMVREIYPEVEQDIPIPESRSQTQVCIVGDIVYGLGETVPFEQPCLKCTCTPPDVHCETEICVPQPGCKAIHRPNKCCPDYQCECEHEGKTYGNGERLPMAPGGECWVCYCRGGEAQCAEVGCYTRSDCKPKYVSGQCCPKYDHCPPRDPLSDRIQYTTETQLSSTDDVTTFLNPIFNATKFSTDTVEEGSGEISSSQSTSISEEIIITSPRPQTITIEETKPRPVTPITFSIKEIELKSNNNKRADTPIVKINKGTQTEEEGRPQITIQEVIPPRSEFKPPFIPTVHKEFVSISPINPVTFKIDAVTTVAPVKTTEAAGNDLESYASEKTEVYDHPPPVLRIGDQLLFVNKGQLVPEKDASTPTPIITLIGAEGLQIGLGSGEIEHDVLQNEDINASVEPGVSTRRKEVVEEETTNIQETTKIEIDSTTTEAVTNVKFVSAEIETNKPEHSDEYIFVTSSEVTSSDKYVPATSSEKNDLLITEISSIKPDITDQEYIPEENPYYPPIVGDIMNLGPEDITTDQGTSAKPIMVSSSDANAINYTEMSDVTTKQSSTTKSPEEISVIPLRTTTAPKDLNTLKQSDSKILPEGLEIIINSTQLPKGENQTTPSLEWLKNEPTKVSIPLINIKAALPDSILTMTAASDLNENEFEAETTTTTLIPTIEDNSKVMEIKLTDKEAEKSEKIMVPDLQQSKETIELNEDSFDSGELITSSTKHPSLMSNEDASVETIKNSSPEVSEVEMMPGYENPIDRVLTKSVPNEEKMIDSKNKQNQPNEDKKINQESPKNDVEMIPSDTEKVVNEEKTHAETQNDFHDEIQKRDVVKKVLKDVFDNPKENIRTDIIPDADPDTVTDYPDYSNEELNNVKPNENFLTPNRNTISNNTKIILHKITTERQMVEDKGSTMNQENVQKVNENKSSEEKGSETLSATTLSVLRDFFKTQFKQYHNSKLTD